MGDVVTDNFVRPAEHLVFGLSGPAVVVDGRVCAILSRVLKLDRLRMEVRGQDPQLDQTLVAIRLAAIASRSSAPGTTSAPQSEPVSGSRGQLNDTVNTSTAATILGITDRAIRKSIAEKRLPATKIDGRYRINREDLATFQATATGATR
ncbi:helix-turn-helix domain-containing protein [Mycolicibacterium sp.]|uniref:helix-turn-helix domain-containing protein n=2 Tax=Mycolicibacterium sp. TaxID=2320850 RepID=UPI0037C97112